MTKDLTHDERLAAALVMLAETFGRTLSKPAVKAYRTALEGLSADDLGRAVKRALQESKFMPSPAELLEFSGRSLAANVADAWEAVRGAMDKHDYTTSVDFGPLVNAVVRNLGGWRAICSKSVPDLVWVRKDFERVYEAFATKPPESLRGEPLRGEFGGVPVRVAIAGVLPAPRLQLESGGRGAIAAVIRQLADDKSITTP